MLRNLSMVVRRSFCDLTRKNKRFQQKMTRYQKQFKIHQKTSKINQQKMADFVTTNDKQKIAYQMAQRSSYDKQLKEFISGFNTKHKNQITLMDFSNYTNQFGDLVNKPLRKQDLDILKQFQKRQVDQRIEEIKQNKIKQNKSTSYLSDKFPQYHLNQHMETDIQMAEKQKAKEKSPRPKGRFPDQSELQTDQEMSQGILKIKDHFVMILLNVKSNTKVTTLNRINSFKTLLFMGNGNGIISHAKGKGKTPSQSLQRAVYLCKKNVIAIPRDQRCTFPLPLKTRFQDYTLYLRPLPGFNSYGHPTIAFMLTLAGIDHCGFKVAHTDKNVYNVLKVFFKAITQNTTPQQLAEREGFKVYRHQFIRPLTYRVTHSAISR